MDVLKDMNAAEVAPSEISRCIIADGRFTPEDSAMLLNIIDRQPNRATVDTYRQIV